MAGPWEKYQSESKPWEKYVESRPAVEQAQEEGALKRYTRGAVKGLPLAGGAVGGLLGSIPGAMLGAAGGAAAQQVIEPFLDNKPVNLAAPTLKGSVESFKYPLEQAALIGAGEGAGQLASKALTSAPVKAVAGKAAGLVGKGLSKIGGTLTGIPEKEIQTYALQADKVKDILKKSGGDIGVAADEIRTGIYSNIIGAKRKLGAQIGEALSKAPTEKSVDISEVLSGLKAAKDKLNPNLKADSVSEINGILETLNKEAPDGKVSIQQLNEIKEYLQEQAKSSYFKSGQIFSRGKDASNASRTAAKATKDTLDALVPEVKQANSQLAQLHGIEDVLNKNLIGAGKSESALMSVGAGTNPRNSRLLQRLGQLTDQDIVGQAEQLAAARRFGDISIDPLDKTGKSVFRTGLGAGLGYSVGGPAGAAVGGALSSPLALKGLIDAGRLGGQALEAGYPVMATPLTRSLLGGASAKGLLQRTKPRGE